jgi:hypothetical protein
MADNKTLMEKIYNGLKEEISPDAVQTKDFGAKTDGYKMGYLIERLNDVLIPLGCSWDYKLAPIVLADGIERSFLKETNEKGKETLTVRVCLSILDPDGDILNHKESFGGCQLINNSLGDTLKGATTDAIKKAFSYMGIGNHAFKGCVDDQMKVASFRRDSVFDNAKAVLETKYSIESLSNDKLLGYFQKTLKKTLDSFEDVMYDDLDTIEAAIEELVNPKKEEVPNEKPKRKSKGTKSKATPEKEELDLQLDDNDETAY